MLKPLVASGLLLASVHSFALSLGGTQGSVIIGRPFDVLVQSRIDAAEAAEGACLEADLTYGDTRVSAAEVTVTIHRSGAEGALRVRSAVPVNEPIVTLLVRAGCGTRFTRSYALLADMEPLPAPRAPAPLPLVVIAPVPVPVPPVPAPRQIATPAPQAPGTTGSPPPASTSTPSVQPRPLPAAADDAVPVPPPAPRPAGVGGFRTKVRPAEVRAEAAATPPPAPVSPRPEPPAVAERTGPRLKLEPLDLTAVAPSGPVAAAPDAPVPQTLSDEGGDGGEGLSAAAGGEATEGRRIQELEAELATLRAEQERMRLTLEAVNAQLARAGSNDRWGGGLFYGLLAVLALLLGTLAAVRWRAGRRHVPGADVQAAVPWWMLPADQHADAPPSRLPQDPAVVQSAAHMARPDLDTPSRWMEGVELHEHNDTLPSQSLIALDAQDLVDLAQQVRLFESLGHHSDAVEVLEAFIHLHPLGSELPYLLWLRLAERTDGVNLRRVEALYERHYRKPAPRHAVYASGVAGLELDHDFVRQLGEVWPQAGALELLDAALCSEPDSTLLQVRTLESFFDLLLLRGVLRRLEQVKTDGAPAAGAAVAAAPLMAEEPVPARQVLEELPMVDWEAAPAGVRTDERPVAAQTEAVPADNAPPPAIDLPPLDFEFHDFDKRQKTAPDDEKPIPP